MMRGGMALLVMCASCLAQDNYDANAPLPPEVLLLARIRVAAQEMLNHLPNFTCLETIERSQRPPGTKKYRMLDTVRLEVALVDGKELFAWPGSPKFEERKITDMVGGSGAIGTGDFALHAASVFLSNTTQFKYMGEETIRGRPAYKFHYWVPMSTSGYNIRIGPAEGVVGYQGFIWNDTATLDLARLEMTIDEIPPQIPLKLGYKLIDYARVAIGSEMSILPTGMEMTFTNMNDSVNRNVAYFSKCRQYTGESRLVFEEPAAETTPQPVQVTVTLPANLTVPAKLSAAFDLGKAAVGDVLKFEVAREVSSGGVVQLPKGATLDVRVDLMVCGDFPFAHCYVALAPVGFRFENKSGRFQASLETPDLASTIQSVFANQPAAMRLPPAEIGRASAGTSILLLRGRRSKVPSGFSTTWRTLEDRGE
jgi:hypothetical protein